MLGYYKSRVAQPVDMPEDAYTRTLRARAFDNSRYLLPLDYQNVTIASFLPNERRWLLGYPAITAHPDLPADGVRGKGIRPDVAIDLAHEADPIARVVGVMAAGR